MTTTGLKLRPCPFCGATKMKWLGTTRMLDGTSRTGFIHSCPNISILVTDVTEEACVTQWNQRSTP